MAVRAVVFDFGGVIVRTEYQAPREHLAERLNMTYEDLSKIVFESETSRLASIGKMTTEAHWAAVARRLSRPASEAGRLREEFFAGDVLDRDLMDYIRSLGPRCKTGLLSNAWPDTRDYLRQNHLEDAFDAVVISAEVGIMKPERGIFELALRQLEVDAHETAFIDDTRINVEAAQQLGLHGILFGSRMQVQGELRVLLP
jgi:epoxide hydrolase-like predicted phosphatase